MAHRRGGRENGRAAAPVGSDESFELFFRRSPAPAFIFDTRTLDFLEVNDAALRLYGYSRRRMLGMKATDIRPRSDRLRFKRAIRKLPPHGVVLQVPGVWTHVPKSKKPFLVAVSAATLVFRGRPACISVVRPVDELVDLRRELSDFREMWREVLENLPDYIVTLDRKGRMLSTNRLAAGVDSKDVVGRPIFEFIESPAHRRLYANALARVFAHGEPAEAEVQTKSGRWYQNKVAPIRSADGRVAKCVVVSRDVTDARRIERELESFRQRWRGVIDSAPDYIWMVDARGKILTINRVHAQLKREQVVGSSVWDWFVTAKEKREFRSSLRAVFERGETRSVICDFGFPDGALSFENRVAPVREEGRVKAAVVVSSEVTSRRRVERAFEESRQLLDTLMQSAPDFIIALDRKGAITFMNRRSATGEEVVGLNVVDVCVPEDRAKMRKALKEALAGRTADVEARGIDDRGQLSWWRSKLGPVRRNGRVVSIVMIARDVTEEKRQADALSRAQARFRGIFEHSRDAMDFVDLNGRLLEVNPAFERLVGYPREELLGGKTFQDLTPPEYMKVSLDAARDLLETGEPVEFDKEYLHRDGRRVPITLTTFLIKDEAGKPEGFAAIVRDNSERRRLEREILQTGAREQSQLGRELHDSLGQELTGISLLAQSLARTLERESPAHVEPARRIAEAARIAVEEVRALAAGLMPAELLPNGLPAALEALSARAERLFGLDVRLRAARDLGRMEDVSLIHLYRIAQEAVTNAAKHAKASKVLITLARRGKRLELAIEDDGVGLSEEGSGLGLKIMRQRCLTLGGTFAVRARPGRGTRIACSVPFML